MASAIFRLSPYTSKYASIIYLINLCNRDITRLLKRTSGAKNIVRRYYTVLYHCLLSRYFVRSVAASVTVEKIWAHRITWTRRQCPSRMHHPIPPRYWVHGTHGAHAPVCQCMGVARTRDSTYGYSMRATYRSSVIFSACIFYEDACFRQRVRDTVCAWALRPGALSIYVQFILARWGILVFFGLLWKTDKNMQFESSLTTVRIF